jgi:uncharacterized membrane protein
MKSSQTKAAFLALCLASSGALAASHAPVPGESEDTTATCTGETSVAAMPKKLSCAGSEPFWGINIDSIKQTATVENLPTVGGATKDGVQTAFKIKASGPLAGWMESKGKVYRLTAGTKKQLTATVLPFKCDDGMSGETRPFTVILDAGSGTYRACCN